MEIIKDKEKIIAIIYCESDWIPGLNFITPGEFFLQVGSWWYPKGQKLQPHFHKDFLRQATKTHEMTYVKQGSMKVTLYNDEKKIIKELCFSGIGEIEILYDAKKDDYYFIEINARPWTQFSLATNYNYNYLQFVTDNKNYIYKKNFCDDAIWIDFFNDLFICFSKKNGLVRQKKISFLSPIFKKNMN